MNWNSIAQGLQWPVTLRPGGALRMTLHRADDA
jgi:hypothetical protein